MLDLPYYPQPKHHRRCGAGAQTGRVNTLTDTRGQLLLGQPRPTPTKKPKTVSFRLISSHPDRPKPQATHGDLP